MSKYKTDYFIFAENVFPGENEKQSIINIFSELRVPSLPTVQSLLSVAVKLYFDDAKPKIGSNLKIKMRVKDPDGEIIGDAPLQDLLITDERDGIAIGVGANGMPISKYGVYLFEILINDKLATSKTLEVLEEV